MKKFIRRSLRVTGAILGILLLAIILIPLLFGEQIKTAVKDYLNDELNATVYFEDVGVSVFRDFPDITVSLDKFGVINKEPFAGDTLMNVEHFRVVVDLFSVFGDQYKVEEIQLDEPDIHVKVNKAGMANYDIMKESEDDEAEEEEEEEEETESENNLKLALHDYEITQGHISYNDQPGDLFAEIVNLNHRGSGAFEGDVYDFETFTSADEVTVETGGTKYMNKMALEADLTVNIDNANSVYTLKENRIGLNELHLHFDGKVAMEGDDINTDLTFETNENQFSHILSMVPGVYTEDFDEMETDGTFSLDGYVKGTYNENSLPGFAVNLGVEKAYFQYPDLPEKVSDINFNVKADCPSGDLNKLAINMPNFHALFGKNPIDARLVLSGVMSESYNIDAMAKATLKLEELLKMFPMEGQDLKGTFTIDGTAKGVYNEAQGKMPAVNATMSLVEGYYKTEDFPSAISNMALDAKMSAPSQELSSASLDVTKFHAEIDGDPIDATLQVNDFDAVNYALNATAKLNFDKLAKILEMEDTEMRGKMDLVLETSGNLAAIEAERYADLPTSGSLKLTEFFYRDSDIPQGVAITRGDMNFTPQKMAITTLLGRIGSSPMDITGSFDNYLSYALLPDEQLTGRMSFRSTKFNVNEWMVEEEEATPQPEAAEAPEEEVEMVAFEVPKGIDFTFDCAITRVLYDNLTIDNLRGQLIMRDQKIMFKELAFKTLGGSMVMNGSYATPDPASPDLDLNYRLTGLDIAETWQTMQIVQDIAPIGKFVQGKLNSSLTLKGKLLPDMTPDLASLTSVGDLKILNGTLAGFKGLDKVADKIKLKQFKELTLNDTKVLYEIHDGRVWIDEKSPIEIPLANGKMVTEGSHGLDQTMDYNMDFDIPAGAAGTAAMQAVGGLINKDLGDRFKVAVGLGGTVDEPKITYVRSEKGESVQDELKDQIEDVKEDVKEQLDEKKEEVKQEVQDQVDDAKEKAKAEAEKIMREAEAQAQRIRDEAKKTAQKTRDEANKKADEIEASAKNPLEKAAKKKLAKKTRDTGEKTAQKIEEEGDQKAQKVIDDARKKADALLK